MFNWWNVLLGVLLIWFIPVTPGAVAQFCQFMDATWFVKSDP
jgi:hypothetical protein